MPQKILIVGSGAQAKYALEIFKLLNKPVIGLITLPNEATPEFLSGINVLGCLEDFGKIYQKSGKPSLILCCSKSKKKEEVEQNLSQYSPHYVNAIHPAAVIAQTAIVGHGVIMNACAVVQPFAKIGNHVMIHAGVIVEHDCILKDFVNLAPRVTLTGHVKVGKGATVCTGAVVLPNVEVGEFSIVGAGGVVLNKVENNTTVVGIPATEIKNTQ